MFERVEVGGVEDHHLTDQQEEDDGDQQPGVDCPAPFLRGRSVRAGCRHKIANRSRDRCVVTCHHRYRNLSVLSAPRAQMSETIQKRTMICGSGHPNNTKWWCSGAMRKIRLRRSLYDTTWKMTEVASITKTPPARTSTIPCLLIRAATARAAPRESDPTSPMNICAG